MKLNSPKHCTVRRPPYPQSPPAETESCSHVGRGTSSSPISNLCHLSHSSSPAQELAEGTERIILELGLRLGFYTGVKLVWFCFVFLITESDDKVVEYVQETVLGDSTEHYWEL